MESLQQACNGQSSKVTHCALVTPLFFCLDAILFRNMLAHSQTLRYAPFCFPIRFAPIIFALLLLLRHFPNCCFWAGLTARSACRCRCLCWSRAAARDAGGLVGGRLSGRLTLVCSAIGRSRAAAAAVPAPSLPRVCVFCVLVLCSGVVGADEGRCTTNNEYAVFDTAKLFANLHKHAHTLLEVGLVAPCVAH